MRRAFQSSITAVVLLSAVACAHYLYEQQAEASEQKIAKTTGLVPSTGDGTPSSIVIDSDDVEGVVGKEVRGIAGENMGRIVEVVVDRVGNVRAAVIDFGGFLGVGSRRIAVDWNLLRFNTTRGPKGPVKVELTPDQVKAAPEYKAGQTVVVVSTASEPAVLETTGSAAREW
jgi:PRC-barrel domain